MPEPTQSEQIEALQLVTAPAPQLELTLSHQEDGHRHKSAAFQITDTGIAIDEDITYEKYVDGLQFFKKAQSNLKVWFADYLSFGKARFGAERVDAQLSQLEFQLNEVTTAINISTVPVEIRHANLDSAHYVILARAKLKPAEQRKWAREASEGSLTPTQLKASIAAGHVVSTTLARQQVHGVATIQGVAQSFTVWLNRVGGFEGIAKLDDVHLAEIIAELDQIGLFYAQIVALLESRTNPQPRKKRKPSKRKPSKKKAKAS